ncbi:hypothetical protein RQP46_007424 [Phenoliferia psychrophenolica]
MASLSTLPPELKRAIASMVALQDATFSKREADGVFTSLPDIKISTPWHGRGSNALFQVSKEWNALTAPVLFETVRASRTFEPIYRHRIINRHGTHTRHLVLDDDARISLDDEDDVYHTYLPHITLIAPMAFPNLERMTLYPQIVDALVGTLPGDDHEREDDGLPLLAFRDLVRPLTSLTIDESCYIHDFQLDIILEIFVNIRTLSFDASNDIWTSSLGDLPESIDALARLDRVQITNVRVMRIDELDQRWETWKPSIRAVDISFEELTPEAWKIVTILAGSAEELLLHFKSIQAGFQPTPISFPRLARLSIFDPVGTPASSLLVDRILPAFFSPAAASPLLTHLNLHSPYYDIQKPPNLTVKVTIFTRRIGWAFLPKAAPAGLPITRVRTLGPIRGELLPLDGRSRAEVIRESLGLHWNSTTTAMLRKAVDISQQLEANEDVVGSGMLIRALNGLRSFLALEED